MIRVLRSSGFEIEDLLERQAPEGATTHADWVNARVGETLTNG